MQEREVVLTKREVEARLVPSGTEIMIPSDTFVTITQSLGGTFTVAVNGNLARIEGHNADALGKKPLESSFETPEDGTVNENQVWEAMQNCYDPEIPVNVVDLGLIYECRIENGTEDGNHVYVLMTLTAAGCVSEDKHKGHQQEGDQKHHKGEPACPGFRQGRGGDQHKRGGDHEDRVALDIVKCGVAVIGCCNGACGQ